VKKEVKTQAKALRRYNSDAVLNLISKTSALRRADPNRFAKELEKVKLDYHATFRDYQLAFVAKLVLYSYDRPRPPLREFTFKDLYKACSAFTELQNLYPLMNSEDWEKFLIRTAYQQFPDFYSEGNTLARTRLLFRSCARKVEAERAFNIDAAYKEATGLTFDQVWDVTVGLWEFIRSRKGGIQPVPIKADNILGQLISESDIAKFVDMISLSPQDFQEKMKLQEYRVDPYETFNPSPLVNWPMIKLTGNRWVVPILPYLFRRGTEQIFYDVIQYKGREFSGFFGYVFEEYTSRILTVLPQSCAVIKEKPYSRNGKSYSTCDWIVIRGGDAVLIECKTKRLGLKTKFTADEQLLRKDITDIGKEDDKGNIVSAIRQLYRTEQDIRENSPGLEEINQKITGRIFPLVLVLDPYPFANAPYMNRIITEELEKGDFPIKGYAWQITDARGIERLCSLAQKEDLITLIADKFVSPEHSSKDMQVYIENHPMANEIEQSGEFITHPVLKSELDAFWDEIKSRYQIEIKQSDRGA